MKIPHSYFDSTAHHCRHLLPSTCVGGIPPLRWGALPLPRTPPSEKGDTPPTKTPREMSTVAGNELPHTERTTLVNALRQLRTSRQQAIDLLPDFTDEDERIALSSNVRATDIAWQLDELASKSKRARRILAQREKNIAAIAHRIRNERTPPTP